jgi:hypothetical protein
MTRKLELAAAEDKAWFKILDLLWLLSPEQQQEPGYLAEGWSVKDLMAHLACWMAEAQWRFEQIRCGTYREETLDVDARNQMFFEVNRTLPLGDVLCELWSAHNRMLLEWNSLPEISGEAEEWFIESGQDHYQEHLPRLREWCAELAAR